MACLFNADLNNNGKDKKSITHEKFISLYGTDPNGIQQANEAYLDMFTDKFKQKLGVDFEVVQQDFRDNFQGKNIENTFVYNDMVLNEQLEPELTINKYGQAWFTANDGSRLYIEGRPLTNVKGAYFTEAMTKELVEFTLYNALGGLDNLINIDFENEIDFVLDRSLGKDQDFRIWLEEQGFSERDINELIKRVKAQLSNRGIKLKDNDDLTEDSENEKEELEETDEAINEGEFELDSKVEAGNDVVKKESYFKNSKDTASANVKILLSLVPKLEAYRQIQLADGTVDYELELAEGELGMVVFEDLNSIWTDLEGVLSNIFTINDGGNFTSALDQMKSQIVELTKDKPSIGFILKYLNDAEKSGQTYKLTQFVQAFTKKKLIFYTTEVEGYKPGEYKYKMFDAASATSKQATLRNTWSNTIESLASENTIFGKDKEGFKINTKALTDKRKSVGQIWDKLKDKTYQISSEDKQTVTDFLNNIGIFPSERGMSKVLREIHEETLPDQVFNESRAYKLLIQDHLKKITKLFDDDKLGKNLTAQDGSFNNPLKSNTLTQRFAKAESTFESGISESTVMLAGSKMAWSYSMPSYVDLRINELINNDTVRDALMSLPYNKRSVWLKELENNPELKTQISSGVFAAIQQKNKSSRGADNKNIQRLDQFADQMNKMLKGVLPNEKPIYYTPAPADKGRYINLSEFSMKTLPLIFSEGSMTIDSNSEGIEIVTGYLEDELDRMKSVWNEVKDTEGKKYVHYHLKKGKDENGNFQWKSEKDGIPIGNGFKSQLFPELNPDNHQAMVAVNDMLGFILYDVDKDSETYAKPLDLTEENRSKLKRYVASQMLNKIKESVADLEEEGVFSRNEENNLINNVIDQRVFQHYTKETGSKQRAIYQATADYLLNGFIANSEYSKLFSGDPAFYKDAVDYNKRIPGSYTDGKPLVGIIDQKDANFNIAVVNGVEIAARDLDKFKENFKTSLKEQKKFIEDPELLKHLTDAKLDQIAETFAKQYNNVNASDAQAWITLDRWKFLKTGFDGWNPSLEAAYQRMKDGTFSVDDLKHAAQPLKGTYFNQDHKNGVPTYLKYSQAVLIPSLTKNTQMDKVREAMEKQGVDELITLDGVKSGALETTIIHDQNGNVLDDLKFNIQTLDNLKWKLQQQLPVKGLKDSADLGSQMQKNIISNLFPNAVYGQLNGEDLTGQRIKEIVDSVTSQLTDIGFRDALNRLGANEEGEITDKEKFYDSLIDKAREDEMPSNIIESLERGYSLDAIPQIRYKSQNIISSIVNKSVAKTVTPGGALIQVSNFGIGRLGVSKQDIQDGGIYMLKDVGSLKRPEMVEKEVKDKDGKVSKKTIVTPGQVFLPNKFIQKYIPDYRELSREDLMKKIDKKLLTLIGYRIPNQKLSSNQPLEIVGILGPEMGDSIVMYTEITTQTGSDFDIDKTYVMLPAFEFNEKTERLEYVKPVISSRQQTQAQVKKFAELQERLNNKEFLEGAKNAFESSKGLQQFGTQEQYNDYIARVSLGIIKNPSSGEYNYTSKVKDIVYHGSPKSRLEKIEGISFWTNEKGNAYAYNIQRNEDNNEGFVTSAIVNIKNPYTHQEDINSRFATTTPKDLIDTAKSKNADGAIWKDVEDIGGRETQTVVFEPEQIHILGSKQDIEGFKEFINQVEKTEISTPRTSRANKKQLQNTLFEVYWQILTSPMSYFDMMSGIDGSQLKDTIDDLHGTKENLSNLELINPIYQLRIKFDNMTGKSGVGLTANQMVDHVYTQLYGISMKFNLGIGNRTQDGDVDLSGIFDTDGNKITDSISMFLNAFVDIAKDPYITKGNFNTVTSNMSFLLLRAGVPLDFVIKYIGQPAFKRVVKKVLDNQSKLGESRRSQFKDFIEEVKSEIRKEAQESGIYQTTGMKTKSSDAFNKYSNLTQIKASDLERMIKGERLGFETQDEQAEYYGAQAGLLETLSDLYDPSEQLAAQVLISKADVNGGGADIVSHFIGMERFEKVMYDNNFSGLDRKFAEGTILGSKTEKSLMFLSNFDENNFITMYPAFKNVYRTLTKSIKNLDYAIDKNIVKEIERGAYASMIASSLEGTAYAYTQTNVEEMFFGDNTTHDKIVKAKKDPETKDNPLIKAFDVRVGKNQIKYITLDNFLQRPSSSNEDLTKAWEELFDTNKSLAIELVRYSIASSGFSKNRHSFHDLLPVRVSDLINNGMDRIRFRGEIDQAVFENFMDDFLRHERNPDQKVTPSIGKKRLTELKKNVSFEGVSHLKKQLPEVFTGIKSLSSNDVIMMGTEYNGDNLNLVDDLNMISENRIIKIGDDLYLNHGVLTINGIDKDGNPEFFKRRLLTKTHKLGYYNNGTYIYEYGQASTSSDPVKAISSLSRNNPKNYDNIKQATQNLLESDAVLSIEPFSYASIKRTHADVKRTQNNSTDLENDGTIQRTC